MERYCERLVVKGYAHKEGLDLHEIFSPVVTLTTIRVVLAMCVLFDLHLKKLDVKNAFFMTNLKKRYIYSNHKVSRNNEKKRKLGL